MKGSRVHRAGYGSLGCFISFPGYAISSMCSHKQVIPFGYCWFPAVQIETTTLIHVLKSSEEINLDLLAKNLD